MVFPCKTVTLVLVASHIVVSSRAGTRSSIVLVVLDATISLVATRVASRVISGDSWTLVVASSSSHHHIVVSRERELLLTYGVKK